MTKRAKWNFETLVEIKIVQRKNYATYEILLDGYSFHEGEAAFAAAALVAATAFVNRKCKKCGCSILYACPNVCCWVKPDLCSNCVPKPSRPSRDK